MRTDEEIVEQTNKLAKMIARHSGFTVPEGFKFYESANPRATSAWNLACKIQEELTNTDPNGALSGIIDYGRGWIYEDELPEDLPDSMYDRWFKSSSIRDGVRIGPSVLCLKK